jgi:hypothetical protein
MQHSTVWKALCTYKTCYHVQGQYWKGMWGCCAACTAHHCFCCIVHK